MKKTATGFIRIFAAICLCLATLAGCTELDSFNSRIDDIDKRLTNVENLCKELNSNISSLQTIVKAIQDQDIITNVTTIVKDGAEVGYTISFAKGQPISIYHGKDGQDGKDGSTPTIGVRQDTDGLWYWTANGSWLLNGSGQKVIAAGTDGKDGKDGVTPQLRINNGFWELSYDNGVTWTQVGKASGTDGKDGDSFFRDVKVDERNVTLILADGTTLVVSRGTALGITFSSEDLVVMHKNSTRDVHYSIETSVVDPSIEVISSGEVKALLSKRDAKTGVITVSTGSEIDEYCKVVVLVTDGSSVIMRTLLFEEEEIKVVENTQKEVPSTGGTVELEFFSNVECEVDIPDDARSWISLAPQTKDLIKQSISLVVSPNDGMPRSVTVTVHEKGNPSSCFLTYEIKQEPSHEYQLVLEREALIDLYYSTDGDNWKNNTDWCSDKPVSEWYGVETDWNTGAVISLRLFENRLCGHIPESIGNLTQLSSLMFEDNELSGHIPDTIGSLSNLGWLNLGNNQLSGTIPETMGNLSELYTLELGFNQIEGPIPDCFAELHHLEYFSASQNFLDLSNIEVLQSNSHFNQWYLTHQYYPFDEEVERNALIDLYNATNGDSWDENTNWCSDKPVSEWYGVTTSDYGPAFGSVTNLRLQLNNLIGTIPESIGNLRNLEGLNFNSNYLSGTIPETIGDLKHLTSLTLSKNQFSGKIPEEIGNLSTLERLCLNDNRLDGSIPDCIAELHHLEYFSASQNFLDLSNIEVLQSNSHFNQWYLTPQYYPFDEEVERNALIDFYNSTNGDSWSDNTNWCSDKPVSEWYGVITTTGSVTGLTLLFNNLDGYIPESIGNLRNLQDVKLWKNKLRGPLPETIGNLSKLESICLDSNELTGIPQSISRLKSLAYLDLRDNDLSGPIPPELAELHAVIHLGLNQLEGPIPEKWVSSPEWKDIWYRIMQGNKFSAKDVVIPAPDFNVTDMDGNIINSSAEYAKNKFTCIYDWATWCPWSNLYTPELKRIYEKYKDYGFEVIGQSDLEDNYSTVNNYVKDNNIKWRNIVATEENHIDYCNTYFQYRSYPQIVLIDSQSRVRFCSSFQLDPRDSLETFLRGYLGEGNPDVPIEDIYSSTDYSQDGKVIQLQRANTGNGIDIIMMGDAFTDKLINDGTYEARMRETMEAFFEEEPYKTYRDCFNVYMVKVVSKHSLYMDDSSTALEGWFGEGTHVGGNDSKVIKYALKAVPESRLDNATVIVSLNSTRYGGTCDMYWGEDNDWGSGLSIAYSPYSSSYKEIVQHEAAGHGFAKLADEYVDGGIIPESEILLDKELQALGWYKNIDFTSDPHLVRWHHFIEDARYDNQGVGIFEGADHYGHGIYRPSYNSIMRYNTDGFNAPSREAIYYKINKLAYGDSWQYNYEDFVKYDAVNRTAATRSGAPVGIGSLEKKDPSFQPLHEPVIIRHDWREEVRSNRR